MTKINTNKLAHFFNRASTQFDCEVSTISNKIFGNGARIKDYMDKKYTPTLASLDKCKAWSDANGVHFGEVMDYIEVK